ncbi:MAG: GNAT family N-acetyltransferase [Planctomycetaceae bacterium]
MDVRRIDDVGAWLEAVTPLLLRDEARHNLLFGVADTLIRHPATYPERNLWVAEEGGAAVGAAIQTPPYNVIVAQPRQEEAVAATAEAIHAAGVRLPGVTGAVPEVQAFAEAWSALAGATSHTLVHQGIYVLRVVLDVPATRGRARVAGPADRDLILGWIGDFSKEAARHEALTEEQIRATVDRRLGVGEDGFLLWEVAGEVVSVAGWGGATPNGVRIGPVFTPPALRKHGYATSLVAELSRQQLARGRRFCFLYTDLANPTSNAIYVRIGYDRVCESAMLRFDDISRSSAGSGPSPSGS